MRVEYKMDDAARDAFAGDGPDSSFVRSLITPAPEDYETELIKFIKQSGVIPEGLIRRTGNSIASYDENGKLEHCGIANAGSVEFTYRSKYLRCRDKKTKESLKDNDVIEFTKGELDKTVENDSSDDEDSGITYKAFMEKTYKLKDPDRLVLPCNYIRINYNYPCWREPVTFTIVADDEINGFTRVELMKKCLQRYHLLYYLSTNYNVDEGKISDKPSGLFSGMFNSYTTNGIKSLRYSKERNYWIFECIEYD